MRGKVAMIKIGDLVIWDSVFSGPIKAKLISIDTDRRDCRIRITAQNHKVYRKLEELDVLTLDVYERSSLYVSSGMYHYYTWGNLSVQGGYYDQGH